MQAARRADPGRPARRLRGGLAAWLLAVCAAGSPLAAPVATTVSATDEAALLTELRRQATAYEHGEGVAKDLAKAAALYCEAARLGDAEAQFQLGWMVANGRGVERDDAAAAYLVRTAAEQGVAQAQRLLAHLGAPSSEPPDCLRPPSVAAVVAPEPPETPPPIEIRTGAPQAIVDMVKSIAPEYQVHPQLALSIMKAESNFDAKAVSPKNAQGLMQLIPETATRFNVKNAFDPKQNLRGGLAYLRWLLAYFEGDLTLVAAAYNAGEGTVERYRGVPPYRETRQYVQRVLDGFGRGAHPFDARVTKPSPQLTKIKAPQRGR